MKRTFVCALLLFAPIWAQEKRPDFSGRWSLNAAKTDYGRMPKPKAYVEVIDHKEPALTITTTSEDNRRVLAVLTYLRHGNTHK